MKPVLLERTILHDGYIRVDRLRIRLASGAVVEREIEDHGQSVAILPFDAARRRALVVRQFRVPVFDMTGEEDLMEACAGMIDDGDPAASAHREAEEELGVRLESLDLIARIWPTPGVSTETTCMYLAPYTPADRFGTGGGLAEEHENITVEELSLADLGARADAGQIVDGKLLTLVLTLRHRRPELFEGA